MGYSADERIKAIADGQRKPTADDKLAILNEISQARFYGGDARIPAHLLGLSFEGRPLGDREPSSRAHLARRVLDDEQWPAVTTEQQYLEDLRAALRHPDAQVIVYKRRGGYVASVLSPNEIPEGRLGKRPEDNVFVVYVADRSCIITGYQTACEQNLSIPEGALWLR